MTERLKELTRGDRFERAYIRFTIFLGVLLLIGIAADIWQSRV